MENPRLLLTVPMIVLALLMGACESSEKKNTAAHPPREAAPPPITATAPVPAAPTKPAEDTAPKPDAVDALIAQAEQHYRQGQANYTAGHLESAKTDFDKAFDTLLQG